MESSSTKGGRGRTRVTFVLAKNVKEFKGSRGWLACGADAGRQYV